MITIKAGQSTSFPRIADAIEAAKAYAPMPVTIHIAPGRYHEKLTVSQPHVTLMGDDASNTILTYDDYAREIMPDGIKRGTFRTYTLFLDAPDITLCNLTVENAAGAGKKLVRLLRSMLRRRNTCGKLPPYWKSGHSLYRAAS